MYRENLRDRMPTVPKCRDIRYQKMIEWPSLEFECKPNIRFETKVFAAEQSTKCNEMFKIRNRRPNKATSCMIKITLIFCYRFMEQCCHDSW